MKKNNSRVVSFFKRTFNLRFWSDIDRVRSFGNYFLNITKKLFIPPKKTTKKTQFEEVAAQLNLNEQDLLDKQSGLYRLSLVMTTVALFIFMYSLYQIFYSHYRAACMSFSLMCVAWALAFRYHFWYYQIKERKLGCSLKEWFFCGLIGEK